MLKFKYTAADKSGNIKAGEVMADDRDSALKSLSERGLLVTKLWEKRSLSSGFFGLGKRRLKSEELLAFTQEMASMLSAGISISNALEIISHDTSDPFLKQIATNMLQGVRSGTPLSELMARYPTVFSKLYISMVSAGETSGKLPEILGRLASYIESSENLKGRVIGAITYPLVVLVFAFCVVVFLFVFAIPRFKEIYEGLGKELPVLTKLFLNAGDFVYIYLYWILAMILLLVAWVWWRLHFESTRYKIDSFLLKSWLVGPLVQRLAIAKFSRILSVLLSSGVPVIRTLELASGSTGNRVLERVIFKASVDVSEGKSLAESLRSCTVFTQMALSMISAGEETGIISQMLDKLADFYELQVEHSLKALTSLLEPVIMIGVGAVVGLIILVLGLPLFNLATTLG